MSQWNVFSNHGHVLLFLSRAPDARLRDVAQSVGITERAVQKIVRDMQDSGVVQVVRKGRRNSYTINISAPLRHELEAHCRVGQLVDLVANGAGPIQSEPPSEATAQPVSKPKPKPKPAPKPTPKPEPAPAPKAKPKPKPKPKSPKKEEKDGGEQGSLF
ncbi:helix-turn-helix transcriptional regulator [Marinihelvus fidelis]|uniref:helix-turn-helix transcriptional regulator n=1 Tax=Marinihelvus fidelis TaxID=2613842 RepID=UPI00177A9DE0|nr:winged helix-turn-helix domain-containing protein [Marinihelvus fidelis]